jgi:hypothetical protein
MMPLSLFCFCTLSHWGASVNIALSSLVFPLMTAPLRPSLGSASIAPPPAKGLQRGQARNKEAKRIQERMFLLLLNLLLIKQEALVEQINIVWLPLYTAQHAGH